MELKEMIKVMQHFEDGGEVEWTVRGSSSWGIVDGPLWNWSDLEYRIKEQKEKVTIEKWLCLSGHEFVIIETSDINAYTYITKKVKLLDTYEVEI